PSKYNLVILDNADPVDRGKTSYNDTLTLRDSAGSILWQKSGINTSNEHAHSVAADPERTTIWVCEDGGSNRLLQYSLAGDLNFEKPDIQGWAVAIDPKTGNAWVLTNKNQYPGEKLVVFGPSGERLHDFDIKGIDIAYSTIEDCFWIVG